MEIGILTELYETKTHERVILIGVGMDTQRSLQELEQLCSTAQLEVVGVFNQKIEPDNRSYCGKGKAEELRLAVIEFGADAVIADDELSPKQVESLEDALDTKVIDRTAVILDIFAARAKSSEGKIQVELAQQKYLYSRLTGSRTGLSRLGGGIGTRGPGEKKLETDRRHIRNRISELEDELESIRRHRQLQRRSRTNSGFKTVALMGYTNAGKSSLLTALTGSLTYSENILFATLDTLTRVMENDKGLNVLIADTVGFIDKLPHKLIDAFRSTLEESIEADLLLHVVDVSAEDYDVQMDVADKVLEELNANQKKIYVFNKIDNVDPLPLYRKDPCCYISAKNGDGIEELKEMILETLSQGIQRLTFVIPYDKSGVVNRLFADGNILSTEYNDVGTVITAEIQADKVYLYQEFIAE
ncbi:MAG: GTPase HflX [Clostridia bacterium]|nr:GTPase HflX [Clostridia bacterium]